MRAGRPTRPVVEVDEEVVVDLHAAVRVAVDPQKPGTQVRVELVVPAAEQRVGPPEPLAVEAQLQHLRPPGQRAPRGRLGLPKEAPQPQLARRATGLRGVASGTSYCRMSPCSQSEKYSQRSSRESTRSVIRPGTGKSQPLTGTAGPESRAPPGQRHAVPLDRARPRSRGPPRRAVGRLSGSWWKRSLQGNPALLPEVDAPGRWCVAPPSPRGSRGCSRILQATDILEL